MDKRNMGGARSGRKALGANLKKSDIDYKNVDLLSKFVSERGKILPKRVTGASSAMQRELAKAIKQSRVMALMPYTKD